jgi:hypothetical protein
MGRVAGQVWGVTGLISVGLGMALLARPVSAEDAGAIVLPDVPPIAVPSGQEVRWIDSITDTGGPEGLTLRFRFLAPQIGGPDPIGPEVALEDMAALCESFALQHLPTLGPQPAQVVISLSDRVVLFGEADDAAVQYFEAYSVADGVCNWEMF